MGAGENYTDKELVEGCLKNDRKFQEMLYRKYARKMYGICLSYTNDRDSAQDILQDGFIKVFKNIKGFGGKGSLEGWIRRIITNTAIDYFRNRARINQLLDFQDDEKDTEISNNVMVNINTENIIQQLQKIPEGARVIFNLYAVEGYSHKEISEKLQISEGTSKSQFQRARQLLQKLLADERY